MRDYLKEIFQPLFFLFFFIIVGKWKKLQHLRQHLLSKEKRINKQHKVTLFLLQVSYSYTRDPIQ